MKKIKNYLLAFIIPLVICLSILYFKGIIQDVENFFVSDLRVQHFAFLNQMKNALTGNASLFYSFYAGMGSPMLATLIFYCISPVNLLLILIDDIRYAILAIYVIKICLSGLTMFILLKSKYGDNSNFITVLFSTCYALSSFVISYFFCVFWFDSLYLAPLVVLGIDKMIKNEKMNLLYILSLALAIICNIQMGFGLCVFSVVYYLSSYSINYDIKKNMKKFKQLGAIFIISSLCAGAISSGALLGFIAEYADISMARDIKITTYAGTSNIGYVLKNMFSVGNLKGDYYNNFEPFIYCGLIISFLSILYLFNKNIDKKKRYCALGVILVFLISFSIGFINVFWHLSSPVMLNFRYSIYLALFLVMLSYECYITKEKLSKGDITVLSILLLIGFSMVVLYSNQVYLLWTSLFLILIFTLILLVKNKSKKFEVLLCIVVIAEIFMNGYLSINTATDIPYTKYGTYNDLLEISSLNDFGDDYRVIYDYSYTEYANDALLLNKDSSLRYFSSVIDGDLLNFFFKNLTTGGNNNYILSAYDSPLLLSLLGAKYFYLQNDIYNNIYNKVNVYTIDNIFNYAMSTNESMNLYLYENPYALSVGYVINGDVSYEDGMSSADYQNAIIKAFTGNDDDVMYNLEYTSTRESDICKNSSYFDCKTYFITNNTGNLNTYVYSIFDEFNVSENYKIYMDLNRPFIISSIDKDIEVTLFYSGELHEANFGATTYNKTSFVNSLNFLRQDMLENISIDGNVMTASIDSSKNGILFLSIPYDDKFKIYVDNEEVEYYSVLDNTFIGLDIKEGTHDIVVKYVNDSFKWYIIFTVGSLVITFVLYFVINKLITKRQIEEKRIQEELAEKRAKNKEKKKQKNKRK